MSPEWPDLVLTTDVPAYEGHVLIRYTLHVEPYSRYRCDDLPQLQLVQNCSFTGGIKADHQNTFLWTRSEHPHEDTLKTSEET